MFLKFSESGLEYCMLRMVCDKMKFFDNGGGWQNTECITVYEKIYIKCGVSPPLRASAESVDYF